MRMMLGVVLDLIEVAAKVIYLNKIVLSKINTSLLNKACYLTHLMNFHIHKILFRLTFHS